MLEKFSIRTQIIGTFVVFSTIFLIVMSSMAVSNISILSSQTQSLSQSSLEQQAFTSIRRSASDTANIIERKIEKARSVIDALAGGLQDLFSENFKFTPRQSYLDYNSTTLPPDTTFSERYGTGISTTTSTFYYPDSYPENLTDGSITTEMWDVINRSSNLDTLFTNLWNSNPDFAWLYVGFQTEGIFRIFPGSTVDTSRQYDPRVRIWYTSALGSKGISTSDPYLDALGQGWMISMSKAVYDSNNNLIGVVSGDLTLGTIQRMVNEVTILNSGYTALVTSDGTILAHPDWNSNTSSALVSIESIEFKSELTWSSIEGLTDKDVVDYSKGGEKYLMAFSTIINGYKVLAIIPEKEAFEAINGIENQIAKNKSDVFVATIAVSIITFLLVVGVGILVSNAIVKPLDRLSKMAQRISMNITSKDIFAGVELDESIDQDDEIGDLARSFTSMVKTLRDDELKKKGK